MKTTAHESFHSNPIMSLMKNSSRTWIKTVSVLGLCLFPALIAAEDNPTPPNILVAIAEDCSWLHFSAYGNQLVNTPAFDRVAREGVLSSPLLLAARERNLNVHGHLRFWATPRSSRL
jgi:hypothetical protein